MRKHIIFFIISIIISFFWLIASFVIAFVTNSCYGNGPDYNSVCLLLITPIELNSYFSNQIQLPGILSVTLIGSGIYITSILTYKLLSLVKKPSESTPIIKETTGVQELKRAPILKRVMAFFIDSLVLHGLLLGLFYTWITTMAFLIGSTWLITGDSPATPQQDQFIQNYIPMGYNIILIIHVAIGLSIAVLYLSIAQYKFKSTLGQKLFKISIIDLNNKNSLTFKQSFIRTIFTLPFQIIAFIPVSLQYTAFIILVVDCIHYFLKPSKQMFHDKLSNTLVIQNNS